MKTRWLSERQLCAIPAILAVIFVLAFCSYYRFSRRSERLGWISKEVSTLTSGQLPSGSKLSEAEFIQSLNDRFLLSYVPTTTLFFVACVAALIIGYHVNKETNTNLGSAIILLILLVVGFAFRFSQVPPSSDPCGGTDFWARLVCQSRIDRSTLNLHLWLDAIGIGVATFIALCTYPLLSWKLEDKHDLEDLGKQARLLQLMLYVGSILLIVATLRLRTILNWSIESLQPYPSSTDSKESLYFLNNLTGFTSNLITFMGALYTLILALIFIPAVLILKRRAGSHTEVVSRVSEKLLHLAAVMGPLLAGSIGQFLSSLK